MKFELNGEKRDDLGGSVERPLTVLALLEQLDLVGHRVAVAVNTEVVPRSGFAEACIQDGDRVEVIQAVGGGG